MRRPLAPHAWVRVRVLRQELPPLWRRAVNHLRYGNDHPPGLQPVRFDGYVPEPAPHDPTRYPVRATDERIPLARLREAVASGRYRANDLIDTGAGWEALSDCLETSDLFAQRRRRAQRIRWTLAAAAMGIATAGLVRVL